MNEIKQDVQKQETSERRELIQENELQYWHEALNKAFFDGYLQAAVVRIAISSELDGSGILAQFIPETDPPLILFHYYPEKENRLDTIAILLHEMIHQYLMDYSKMMKGLGIEVDVDKTGKHTKAFYLAAENRGLTSDGRNLTPEARERITKMVDQYNRIMNIKIY